MSKTFVTGLFKTRAAAEAAVDAIIKRGYTRDDISVLMSDSTRNKEFAVQTRSHAADGLGVGGAIGGTIGAVLAAIAAVGTSISNTWSWSGRCRWSNRGRGLPAPRRCSGATGGVIGMLVGTGIPEHRARVYDTGVRGGGILLGVEAKPLKGSTSWRPCSKTSAPSTFALNDRAKHTKGRSRNQRWPAAKQFTLQPG